MSDTFKRLAGQFQAPTRQVTDSLCPHCSRPIEQLVMHWPQSLGGRSSFVQKCPCVLEREEAEERQKTLRAFEEQKAQEFTSRMHRFALLDLVPEIPERFELDRLDIHPGNAVVLKMAFKFIAAAKEQQHTKGLPGFAVWGANSVGKTHLLKGIAKMLLDNKISAVILNQRALTSTMSEIYSDTSTAQYKKVMDDLCCVSFLAFDDLGKGKSGTIDGGQPTGLQRFLWDVVDARTELGLATFVSSNFSYDELLSKYWGHNTHGIGFMQRLVEAYDQDLDRWHEVTDTVSRRVKKRA